MPLGGDPRVSMEGRALNSEDTEQLKQFQRRLEGRPGLGEHLRLQNNSSKPWLLRAFVPATWYVLLAAAAVSTIYHLLVI
jgi:hypothetical protein